MTVKIEIMSIDECKNDCMNLVINYSFANSHFGKIIIASTNRGICYLAFLDDKTDSLLQLKHRFAKATLLEQCDSFQQQGIKVLENITTPQNEIKLHLKGTDFQLKVWKSLLKIPLSSLSSYGAIATLIEMPKASRAVGTAIGQNPIAFLIPCHRVIQKSGKIGGYMWGEDRKKTIISYESSLLD